ncbi:unnamed protein product [Rhizophagus irregularis]|nr:unnamed protein product [Rhizophagus irregularis]
MPRTYNWLCSLNRWWAFIDALVYNRVNVTIEEVITGIITTLGMIIVALIDKSIFSGEFYIFPRRMLWRARLYLFFGFTLLVGGLIGSVFYFVYKYLINHYYTSDNEYYFGVAVVVQNGCILMSSLILLIGQYSNNEAKYDFL